MTNEEEPREPEEEPGEPEEGLSQDPFVEKRRPDPSEPPIQVRVLQGLLGNSDREGYKRLYFTRELNSYAEFRQDDVVFSEPIAPEQPPFVGLDATRVGIRRDAAIEYTRVRTPRPVDEFDIDVRLMATAGIIPRAESANPPMVCPEEGRPHTHFHEQTCLPTCGLTGCGAPTCMDRTCQAGFTCIEFTCQTCQTQCDQNSCRVTECGPTCVGTCVPEC